MASEAQIADMSALTHYEAAIARQLDRRQARRREREAAGAQPHTTDKKESRIAEGNQ